MSKVEQDQASQEKEPICNDIMLDLETLGTRSGDAVISIGAAQFNREQSYVGPVFSMNLDLVDLIDVFGFSVSGSTLKWWMGQNTDASYAAVEGGTGVVQALMDFARFVTDDIDGGSDPGVRIWGNGAGFDNVLLSEMYQRLRLQAPWKFWNDRCFRTFKNEFDPYRNLMPTLGEGAVGHRALDDALWQTYYLLNMDAGFVKYDDVGPDGHAQLKLDLKNS